MSKLTPEEKARRFNDPPLRMIILDAAPRKEGGLAVVGRIESGSVNTGDKIFIAGIDQRIEGVVEERFVFHPGTSPDSVHLWMTSSSDSRITPGMIVTKQAKSVRDFIAEEEHRKTLEVPFRMVIEQVNVMGDQGMMLMGEVEFGSLLSEQAILVNADDKMLSLHVSRYGALCGPHTAFKNMGMIWVNDVPLEDVRPGMIVTTEGN